VAKPETGSRPASGAHRLGAGQTGRPGRAAPPVVTYGTSIETSDILREYVMRRYGLHATRQTTPEFLTSILPHPSFTPPLQELLADFLGTCDQIKYARVDPGVEASEHLLQQARAFIDQVS
jgi:hypothetical protein